jgi:hypothetical protein
VNEQWCYCEVMMNKELNSGTQMIVDGGMVTAPNTDKCYNVWSVVSEGNWLWNPSLFTVEISGLWNLVTLIRR